MQFSTVIDSMNSPGWHTVADPTPLSSSLKPPALRRKAAVDRLIDSITAQQLANSFGYFQPFTTTSGIQKATVAVR